MSDETKIFIVVAFFVLFMTAVVAVGEYQEDEQYRMFTEQETYR